ncbi:MAG: CDP-glycerol glycerophosphotransferase family protein [bacterium]|nr:CDP-glycerol glycerophosphotransferase family protein [bacterium]
MKTIFFSCFHPYTSRNILSTDAFRLLAQERDVRIVLFVHSRKKDFIERLFGASNVIVEGISLDAPSRTKTTLIMKRVAKYCLNSHSVRIQRYMKWRFEKKYAYFFVGPLAWLVSASSLLRRLMRAMDYFFAEKDRYKEYFNRYKPNVVFITDVLNERDVEMAHNARFFSVPIIGMVRSWDNLTLHGLMRFLPDTLLVASQEIKRQAEKLNDCPQKSVHIVGIPHYDKYAKGARISREEFYRHMNIRPDRPTILFAPIGDFYIAHNTTDAHVVSVLGKTDYNVIVRFSPTVPVSDMQESVPPANTIFDRPGVNFIQNVIADQELSVEDDDRLLHEIMFSNAVICGPSTVALDAVFLDTPVIIINFHPDTRGYYDGIARRYDYDHFRFAIDCGAFRVANSKEELFSLMEGYINDRSRDAKNRSVLCSSYCGPDDGMSGARVAQILMQELRK